jgi:TPR repeat protein
LERDYSLAKLWSEKAAAGGCAAAQNRLGDIYYLGQGVKQDHALAKQWYGKAAAQGDAGAQYNLGNIYKNGDGVKRDHAMARQWYEKAAAGGSADAQNSLGNLYFNGQGATIDYAAAQQQFQDAAEQGHAEAQAKLDKNTLLKRTAFSAFLLAVAVGGAFYIWQATGFDKFESLQMKIIEILAFIACTGTALRLCFTLRQKTKRLRGMTQKAFFIYLLAVAICIAVIASNQVARDTPYYQNNLGNKYYSGQGVERDYAVARQYFEKAAAGDYAVAQYYLGLMYENGQGVEQDRAAAQEWYEKAAEQGYGAAKDKLNDM